MIDGRWRRALVGVVLLAAVAACEPAASPAVTAPAPDGPITTSVVAKDIAFRPPQLAMPADTPIRFELDNQDAGVPHGIAIMGGPAFDIEVVASDVEAGPVATTLDVPSGLVAGAYRIICPVHPTTMTAELTIAP